MNDFWTIWTMYGTNGYFQQTESFSRRADAEKAFELYKVSRPTQLRDPRDVVRRESGPR